MPRTRPKFGDVLEVSLPNGKLGYVQYVHRHRAPPRFGPLIRVLKGKFTKRPDEFAKLVAAPEQFVALFPIGLACARGDATIVANYPVPERFCRWPLFKSYNENYGTGERDWYLWDGTTSRRVGTLAPKHYDLPSREILNLAILKKRISASWRNRDDVRQRDKA